MLRRTLLAVVLLGAVTLAGCTAAPVAAPLAAPVAVPVAGPAPTGDGTLSIGTLFPMTGVNAASGAAQVAGAEVALRDILAGQAAPFQPVQLIHRNSAGDLAASYADLVARGVDLVLWDATTALPTDAEGSVGNAAIVALSDFANGGTPLAADEAFTARLTTADPGIAATAGGAEAYDGVVTAALAAAITGDDGGASIEAGWPQVTAGSAVCTSWGECVLALAETGNIDYQGITGRRS
ncbi:ABC transporter substrate-binding protein [Cryobacterium gelidum]|uniref:ABC transporter substrate-binding protein n=1 Tax=Cryobacterium gelidum TaxID=1259164 RepID=A0A4R9AV28_9MICO|nr:ABC transporter substrate-binding protein [Cryobacterium gelidum]TFD70319.1 ABC transporter substrate-binding protein [Cryobacterium gelidum]